MRRLGALTLLAAISALWFANAWITDDAFITFRSIEQLFAGNGLRFNVHERVQPFTHPLWLGLLLPLRAGGLPLPAAAFALSWACTLAAAALLGYELRDRPERWLAAVAVLAASRTLFDYTASGLETPLSLLLVVLFVLVLQRRDQPGSDAGSPIGLYLVAGLLLLARHDHAPLVAPAVALVAWRRRRAAPGRWWRELALGFAPFAVWSSFAFVYYGSPLPNTALAKLGAGVARSELALQGLRYLVISTRWDLLWLPLVAAGIFAATRAGRLARALAFGIALHLVYVVSIGGDFMAGRFLAPSAAAALALTALVAPVAWVRAGGVLALLLLAFWPRSALRGLGNTPPAWQRGEVGSAGVVDERLDPEGSERLASLLRTGWPRPGVEPLGSPRRVGTLGRPSYRTHPRQILVDRYGLADPFLARLRYEPPWQIGHFRRRLPDGYLESLAAGDNRIVDPNLAELYDRVRTVVSGPLFDFDRLVLAARLLVSHRSVSAPEARCPTIALRLLGSLQPLAGVRVPVIAPEIELEDSRLIVRGIAPLGEGAGRWLLAVAVAPLPDRSELRCSSAGDTAALRFEVELEYAGEREARAAAASAPRLHLEPALR